MHLLYVDDDPINVMLFRHACSQVDGLHLQTATSGHEALQMAKAGRPDVLVIDRHLPDIDGFELLRQMRDRLALGDVPAFMCSADDDARARQESLHAGFTSFWHKPVDIECLRGDLERLRRGSDLAAG